MDQAVRPSTRSKKSNGKAAKGAVAPPPVERIHTRESLAEAESRQILAALQAFAGGDFSMRLPATWTGTEGRIAEAFNACITNAQNITGEAERLSNTVGKEGRLSQRITTAGATGS